MDARRSPSATVGVRRIVTERRGSARPVDRVPGSESASSRVSCRMISGARDASGVVCGTGRMNAASSAVSVASALRRAVGIVINLLDK